MAIIKQTTKTIDISDYLKKVEYNFFEEFHEMLANFDLSTAEKIKAFSDWKEKKGIKEGLIKNNKNQ